MRPLVGSTYADAACIFDWTGIWGGVEAHVNSSGSL